MLESIIAMFFLVFVFFLVVDYAELLKTRTVMDYAAARGARARAVGFNDFMVTKTLRIATMPVAGECLTAKSLSRSLDASFLISRSGSYLEAEHENETQGILDFELWNPSKFNWSAAESDNGQQGDVNMTVRQRHPLLSEINGCGNEVIVEGKAQTESHYHYYLK